MFGCYQIQLRWQFFQIFVYGNVGYIACSNLRGIDLEKLYPATLIQIRFGSLTVWGLNWALVLYLISNKNTH